jgi:hypothetical protein
MKGVGDPAIRANGTVFKSMYMFAARNFGEEAVQRCLYALPPRDRELLTGASAVGWYPVAAVFRFLRAVDSNCGSGDLKLCHDVGRFAADWQLNSFHKIFLRFKSPAWLFDKGTRLFNQYYDGGRFEIAAPQPGRISGRLHDFIADEAFCARERGWIERAIELTGGRGASVTEPRCRNKGDSFCEYVATFRH